MSGADPRTPSSAGPDPADPVAAAREWLQRNGGAVPAEPEGTGTRRSGASGRASADAAVAARARGPGLVLGATDEVDPDAAGSAAAAGRRRRSGSGLTPEQSADVEADPESVARAIVLRKLTAQARTRHELTKALAARQVPEEVADGVLDRFEAVGLVDDAGFARDWVASRQQRRHLSRSALRRELQSKGVERELVEEAVGEVDADDEVQAARQLAERKLRSMVGLPREVQYRRLAGALARRGFGPGVTRPVLNAVLNSNRGL